MVVLPFANIGGGPEQEHFVDGVTESLTTDLSRIRGSFVMEVSALIDDLLVSPVLHRVLCNPTNSLSIRTPSFRRG